MNQRDLMFKRNESARLLEFTSRGHRNCVRFNTTNGVKHEMKKAEVCYYLKLAGIEYCTEAEFVGKESRADIMVLDDNCAIEIIDSESPESIELKRKKYPCQIMTLNVNEQFKGVKI